VAASPVGTAVLAPLADGAGQANATLLLLGAAFIGWIAVRRLRGKALDKVPRGLAWVALTGAVALAGLGVALPSLLSPSSSTSRPSSAARIEITSPADGQVFAGSTSAQALVPVEVRLLGARIVPFTSTRLRPDEGHLHLFLDGSLVSMSGGTTTSLDVGVGAHVLRVEFVASDHAPFDPPVTTSVRFTVRP
jgi:hypothetical protein